METKPGACQEVRENLSAYVDGEVTKSERMMVETHLSECGACRDQLAETMRVIAAVAALPRFEPGPAYLTRLKERMEQPDSLLSRLSRLLDDRMAISGLSFAMGAAACLLVFSYVRPPAAPAPETSVEVAAARARATLAPARQMRLAAAPASAAPAAARAIVLDSVKLSGAPVALAAVPGVTPYRQPSETAPARPAGAPVRAVKPDAPVVLAAAPRVPAPLIVPASPAVRGIAETELDSMRLEVGTEPGPPPALAGAPQSPGSALFAKVTRAAVTASERPERVEMGRWAPGNRMSGDDHEEISAAVAAVPEPPLMRSELVAALGGATLVEGDEAERAAASGSTTQVMVSSPPAFLRELVGLVGKAPGARLTRVLVLSAPALEVEVELSGEPARRAQAAAQLNADLARAASVKAVAAASTPEVSGRMVLHVPLAQPVQ